MPRSLSSVSSNRDSDDECAVTKPDISVGQCFKNLLAKSLERGENPDEKFTIGQLSKPHR